MPHSATSSASAPDSIVDRLTAMRQVRETIRPAAAPLDDELAPLHNPEPEPRVSPPLPEPLAKLEKPAKLTAAAPANRRKRQIAAATAGGIRNADITPDSAFEAMFAKASETSNGRRIVTTEQAESLICGIPLPALSSRFIFQQNVLPLSRQIMIFGDPGSAKSALLAEMYRWVLCSSGLVVHIDNENKDGPDLRNAILYRDPTHCRKIAVEDSDCQQDWMEAIRNWKNAYDSQFRRVVPARRDLKRKDGENAAEYKARTAAKVLKDKPGYIYPLMLGVDSLTGTSSSATIQGIDQRGSPKNRFQEEAKFLSDYAKALPAFFRSRPAVLVMVNHRKDQINEVTGMVSDRVPGGNAMRYMDSTEIKAKKIGKIENADFGGIRVEISNPKNSLGPTGGRVTVDFKWWYEKDPATGKSVQRAAWDWDAATIDLLLDFGKKYAGPRDAIRDIVDLNPSSRKVWSDALGIPASKPVSFSEAGRLLEADRPRMQALQDVLHIKERTIFEPGCVYGDLRQHLLAASQRRESVYAAQAAVDLSGVSFIEEELDRAIAGEEKKKQTTKRPVPVALDDDEEDT